MRVMIVEAPGSTVVGVIEDWTGPLPHPGEYIYHPPFTDGDPEFNVMSVKTVTWRMLARPHQGSGVKHFIAHGDPYVEIHV